MRIGELIKRLQKFDPQQRVYMYVEYDCQHAVAISMIETIAEDKDEDVILKGVND